MNRLLLLSYRNLRRNFRRNLATGIAIGFGFAALVALVGYINRADNFIRAYTIYALKVGHITVMPQDALDWYAKKPAQYSFDLRQQRVIEQVLQSIQDVELKTPLLFGNGLIGNGCKTVPFSAVGSDPQVDKTLQSHPEFLKWCGEQKVVEAGRSIWAYDESLAPVMLANGLARILHKEKVHDAFNGQQQNLVVVNCAGADARNEMASDANVQFAAATWDGNLTALDGEVVGVFNPGSSELQNAAVVTSVAHLQKLYETENVGQYAVWLKNPMRTEAIKREIEAKLRENNVVVDVMTWNDERINPFYVGTIRFMRVMVAFIGLILISIVVFSIFNTATITALERVQEMGMMRSLGFTKAHLRHMFMLEAALLCVFSLLGGGALAAAVIQGVNALEIKYYPPGVAGGINLMLIPSVSGVLISAALVFISGMTASVAATRSLIGKKITEQLMGHQR